MATTSNNRFALFATEDDSVSPPSSPEDLAKNPFLNQVDDDPLPWEEVKKRNTPLTATTARPGKRLVGVTNDRFKCPPVLRILDWRERATSQSTADCSEKHSPDIFENWCGACSLKFPSKTALLSHIKASENHENYCNLCKRVFKDRNGLKNHVDNAAGHETYCNLCLSAFKDEWGLRNHLENNPNAGHQFVCMTCLLAFHTESELGVHLILDDKHVRCKTCRRGFRNQEERDQHWLTTNRHKHCMQPGCEFDGPNQAALTEHLKRDHFQCQGCKEVFPSLTKLNHHYEGCSFAVACSQCGEKCGGKSQLEVHLKHCLRCEECGYHTQHEGNFQIHHQHMTKHSPAELVCWGCDAPMRKHSSLINHLESGNCPSLSDPALLMRCLGTWWYSPLYMDLDMHAHIRTGRVDIHEVWKWMAEGALHPFLCRDTDCGKTFSHLSSLLLHCESKACGWDVNRLNMPGLEAEFKRAWLRRDSGTS
ncbi:uncharacterized protein yc1106_03365 [Curvularia clavata]|uniref:C2H2-type domain-containing protein n=1 Tax=Curvularia clavata TaxID=95742 RepID=A0A9Q8Z4G2_CURCL|nr:uncharacterized protein yc1106_03365 [Curvularia clavata]